MTNEFTCLILAAGKSRRFGSPKMHHVLASGLSVLQTTVQQYASVFNTVNVLVNPEDHRLKPSLSDCGVTIIEVARSHEGLSQSIVQGVQRSAPTAGYLIALGDMPFVTINTLELVKNAMRQDTEGKIITLSVNGKRGNPIAFSHTYKKQLLTLVGDIGAKAIVKNNQTSLINIEVDDIGVFQDIDVLSDIPASHAFSR